MNSASLQSDAASFGLPSTSFAVTERAEVVKIGLLSAAYFFLAFTGIFTAFDALGFALGVSLILPSYRPYLLLLVVSVHDAPGQADPSVYGGVLGITALMLMTAVLNPSMRSGARSHEDKAFTRLVLVALALVAYGLASSWFNQRMQMHEQLADRPWYILGGLMGLMIVSGFLANRMLLSDPLCSVRLRTVCALILGNILFVTLGQTVMGPSFGASRAGIAIISQLHELMDGGDRGMARLTGPFLSPNTLAMLPSLYLLLFLRGSRSVRISNLYLLSFVMIGLCVSVLGGARSMFGFYVLSSGLLVWTQSPQRAITLGMLSIPFVFAVGLPLDDLLQLMRFQDVDSLQSLGMRGAYWNACIHNLTSEQWMFGSGLSHWPVFLKYHVGYPGADPHSWVFSMAGSFGSLGILFYLYLGVCLFKRSLFAEQRYRAIALCLILQLLGRDLANVQYVINNHAMGALYWIAISSAFVPPNSIPTNVESEADWRDELLMADLVSPRTQSHLVDLPDSVGIKS